MTSMEVARVKLGLHGLEVSQQGLGCMGMSYGYGPPNPEQDMIELIHKAVESGTTVIDTAGMYGPNTNEVLVGKTIKGIRHKVELATKFGKVVENGEWKVRGDPAYVRTASEASLKRLDVDYIDLYYQHRVDSKVPIEITVGEMKKLVEEGKLKVLGLSEASPADIQRAHAITAVQVEWSLWSRDIDVELLPTCREMGIGIVPKQGTTKIKNLEENIEALAVKLTLEELKKIQDAVPQNEVAGNRYPDVHVAHTWMYTSSPPLASWT